MIARYSLPRMRAIWSEENRYQKWLDIELAVCEIYADIGVIPKASVKTIKDNVKVDSSNP